MLRLRWSIVIVGILACAVAMTGLLAAEDKVTKAAPLKLILNASSLTDGMPDGFTFTLINSTDHDFKLPSPDLECSDSIDGTVVLRVEYITSHGGSEPTGTGGCAGDLYGGWPSIFERVKTWKTLGAGETLILKGKRDQLFYSDKKPGRYEFWAAYEPPYVEDVDQQLLFGSGFDFLTRSIVSSRLTFERKPGAAK